MNKKMGQAGIVNYQMEKLYSFSSLYDKKLVMFTFGSIFPEGEEKVTKFSEERPNTWFYNSIPWMRPPEEAFPDGHPTVKGYTKIANHLFDYLTVNKLIPCN